MLFDILSFLEFCWVFLSFLSFSDEFSWYSRCSNFKYQLKNVLDPRLIPCWTTEIDLQSILHLLSFLEFSEFSEFFWVFRDFRIPQTLFWVDSKLFFIGFGFYRAWSPYTAQARSGTPNYWFFGFSSLSFLSFLSFGAGWPSKIFKKCILSDGWFVLVMVFLIDSANLSVSDVLIKMVDPYWRRSKLGL